MNENSIGKMPILKASIVSLGLLIALIVGIIILASVVSGQNAAQIGATDQKATQLIAERIKPVGQLNLPKDGGTLANVSAAVIETVVPAANAASDAGKATYDKACFICHATGVAGAPKLGDAATWAERIKQDMKVLEEHAIKGFTGKTGAMPAKGGNSALSDDDVKAAVKYMVDAVKK
ncbi:c-type cytochrome [Pseudomonadota bacterium]